MTLEERLDIYEANQREMLALLRFLCPQYGDLSKRADAIFGLCNQRQDAILPLKRKEVRNERRAKR